MTPLQAANSPRQIVTREKGAYFYCVACQEEYRKCKCTMYRSADTLSRANHAVSGSLKGHPSRAFNPRKAPSPRKQTAIIKQQDGKCFYCQRQFSNTLLPCFDHVVPFDWCRKNKPENFVAACARCNAIKSDKIFTSIEEAKEYILKRL